MKMNWTAIIMTVLTVFVGLACAVIALTLAKDNATASGLLFGIAGAALGAFIKQPQKVGGSTSDGATPRAEQDAGFAHSFMCLLLLTVASAFAIAVLFPMCARADSNNPSSGGCAVYEPNSDGTACEPLAKACTCKVSFQASAITPLVVADLKTGDVSVGVQSLGACYGATYAPTKWYASGLDYCFAAKFAQDSPNTLSPLTFMVHLADYGSFGAGPTWTARSGSNDGYWRWMFYMSGRFSIN